MDSYSVQAVLSAVDKNFTSTMNGARNALGGIEAGANRSRTSIMSIAAGVGVFKLVSKAIGTVTSSLGSAISRFDTLNNYPKVMAALGYSTADANTSIKKLSAGIEGLPTTLDGIASSAQMLTASFGDLNKGTDVAIALNDMFLAGGQGAEAASRALTQYNQILARGKVGQQEWNTLLEVAPAQIQQLATELLGASANQDTLKEALMGGTLSLDEFNDAIVRLDKEGGEGFASFADQAISATGGIKTAMTNLKSAVTKGLANTLSAIDAALESNGLPKLGEAINSLKPRINDAFGAVNGLIRGLTDLQGTGKATGVALAGLFAAGSIQGLPVIVGALRGKLDQLGGSARAFVESTKGIVEKLGPKMSGAFGKLKAPITGFLEKNKNALSAFGQRFSHIGQSIGKNIPIVGKLGEKFKSFGNFAKSAIDKIGGPIVKIGGVAAKAGGTFVSGWARALSTVGRIALKAVAPAALVGAVIAGLGILQRNFGPQIAEMAKTAAEKGPEVIGNFVNGIVSELPLLMRQGTILISTLTGAIAANVPAIAQGAVDIILALVNGIAENSQSLMQSGLLIIAALAQALLTAAPQLLEAGLGLLMSLTEGMTSGEGMSETGKTILQTLVSSLSAMAEMLLANGPEIIARLVEGIANALPDIIAAAIRIIQSIATSLINHLPDILAAAVRIVTAILQGIVQSLPKIIQGAAQLITTLARGLIQNFPKIVSAAKQIIVTIGNTLKSLASQALQWGRDIINGIAQGIRNAIGNIASAASSIGSKIKEYLHFSRPDRGPLREYEKWMPDMMRGIAQGIVDNISLVQDAAAMVAGVIAGAQQPFNSHLAYSVGGDVTYGYDLAALAARPIVIDNSIEIDGREMAKGSASYIQTEMATRQKLNSFIQGSK